MAAWCNTLRLLKATVELATLPFYVKFVFGLRVLSRTGKITKTKLRYEQCGSSSHSKKLIQ
jgi:hypothetical protein